MSNKTPDQLAKLFKFTLERMKEKVNKITYCTYIQLGLLAVATENATARKLK